MARTSNWIVKTAFVVTALAGFLAVSFGEAPAIVTTIHQSNEFFYDSGGTAVSGCVGQGCPSSSFSFGSTTGAILWHLQEVVNYDSNLDVTTFSYIVGIPLSSTLSADITSFHVADTGGNLTFFSTAPLGWLFTEDLTYWHWETARSGIAKGSQLPGFSVTLAGNIPVGFDTTYIDLGTSHTDLNGANWMASADPDPVPETSSLLLLGSGLVGLGLWRRRQLSLSSAARVTSTPNP